MPMTLEDGFKMLKRQVNPDPKQRMHFWYGHEQALLLDKAKVGSADLKTRLGGKPPKSPFCYGRIGLHDVKGSASQELRVDVAGAVPTKLAKDLKAEAAKHGLRAIDVVVDDGLDEQGEELAQESASSVSIANRQKLAEAIKALLQKKPQLRDAVDAWLITHDDGEAMSADELARAIDELSKVETARKNAPEGTDPFQAKVMAAAARARDRRPDQGKQIADLVRAALGAFAAKKAAEAKKALDALEAMWNQDVVDGKGGGGDFEQQLLAAASGARTNNPGELDKIAQLVQHARDQNARRTEPGDKAAKEALEQLKLLAATSANLRDAKTAASTALAAFRKSVNSAIEKGTLQGQRTQATQPLEDKAAAAEKAIRQGDFDGALKLVAEGERALRELETNRQDGLARQETKARVEETQKAHDRVQQHVDKLKDKRGGVMSDYQEGKVLGEGANGRVSEIVSKSGGATLVMKTPKGNLQEEELEAVREDLEREASMASAVGAHPNIAQCFGVVEVEGTPRLLMEKISGGDMRSMNKDLLAKRQSGALSEEEYWGAVQFTFAKMLEALAHVAEKGYVHGDIKPENVMIDAATGEPKLIDLGSMTKKGDRSGPDTPAYRAPERPAKSTTGVDTFATGATMWEVGEGNTGKDKGKLFDYGGKNTASFPASAWHDANMTTPGDETSIPQDWHQLASPALRVGDNKQPATSAFTTQVTNDPKTNLPAKSKAEKKLGTYATDSAYVDFINRLMHPNAAQRMSPQEALAHPFLRDRLLDDAKAKAVVQGTVAPAEDTTPFGTQVSALARDEAAGRKEADEAADRAVKVDKLAQAVESEAAALKSGKGKPTPALAGPKLQPMLDDGARRLGGMADRAQALRRDAEALKAVEVTQPRGSGKDGTLVARSGRAREDAGKTALALDAARQSLHAAVVRLERAMKDRPATS